MIQSESEIVRLFNTIVYTPCYYISDYDYILDCDYISNCDYISDYHYILDSDFILKFKILSFTCTPFY